MNTKIIKKPIVAPTTLSRGFSKAAEFVSSNEFNRKGMQEDTFSVWHHAFSTDSLNSIDEEIDQVASECELENWDGYGASPVSAETLKVAHRFVCLLPAGFSAPSVGADPDGHITFEWYQSPERLLIVSLNANSMLYYAFKRGAETQNGAKPFFDNLPNEIVELIRRVKERT